ncbi:MAG TPA: hypothetical protein VGG03_10050 [Thermoanaerobaculia bacterium]
MSPKIFRRVLPLAEEHIGRCFQDPSAALSRTLVVSVDILNMHGHILVDLIGTRRAKLGPLAAEHHGTLAELLAYGLGNEDLTLAGQTGCGLHECHLTKR